MTQNDQDIFIISELRKSAEKCITHCEKITNDIKAMRSKIAHCIRKSNDRLQTKFKQTRAEEKEKIIHTTKPLPTKMAKGRGLLVTEEENPNLCPICLEIDVDRKLSVCNHRFCHKCLVKCANFRNTKCPICRADYKRVNIVNIQPVRVK